MSEPNASHSEEIRPDEAATLPPRAIPPRAAPRIDEAETLPPRGAPAVLAGRWRVVRQLGQGGMGSVWLAEDTKLDNRPVAVKMLPSIFAGKPAFFRQVKDEALVAMRLSHPNIATVRAFEEDESGNPFLVMDYVEGRALDDILAEKGRLSPEEAGRLLEPVAAALDYAHSQGVVHRDVKPGNVIVRTDGTPFVLDFGIAGEIRETMTRVTGKSSGGTLLYMSPEQLHGRPPTAAQDVYSFAAMAYECFAGHPPFTRGQIEWQIDHDVPEPLPESAGAVPGASVMAGLSKDPAARPASCAGVLGGESGVAVSAKKTVQPVAAEPADPKSGRRKWKWLGLLQRKWVRLLLLGLAVFGVSMVVFVVLIESYRSQTWSMENNIWDMESMAKDARSLDLLLSDISSLGTSGGIPSPGQCWRAVNDSLPQGVRLTVFTYAKKHDTQGPSRSIALRGEAESAWQVRDFIAALEKTGLFAEVRDDGVLEKYQKCDFRMTLAVPVAGNGGKGGAK